MASHAILVKPAPRRPPAPCCRGSCRPGGIRTSPQARWTWRGDVEPWDKWKTYSRFLGGCNRAITGKRRQEGKTHRGLPSSPDCGWTKSCQKNWFLRVPPKKTTHKEKAFLKFSKWLPTDFRSKDCLNSPTGSPSPPLADGFPWGTPSHGPRARRKACRRRTFAEASGGRIFWDP